jgi:hypothetical protein
MPTKSHGSPGLSCLRALIQPEVCLALMFQSPPSSDYISLPSPPTILPDAPQPTGSLSLAHIHSAPIQPLSHPHPTPILLPVAVLTSGFYLGNTYCAQPGDIKTQHQERASHLSKFTWGHPRAGQGPRPQLSNPCPGGLGTESAVTLLLRGRPSTSRPAMQKHYNVHFTKSARSPTERYFLDPELGHQKGKGSVCRARGWC